MTVNQEGGSVEEETAKVDDEQEGSGFPVVPIALVMGLIGVLLAAVGYRRYSG